MKRSEYAVIALIVVLGLLTLAVGSRSVAAQIPTPSPVPLPGMRTISVSGEGQASAQPDRATVTVGVQTDADTAAAALSGNNQQMQALLDAMRQGGVTGPALQTQQVQLTPRYTNPGQQGGTPQLAGYTALNMVQVRVDDLSKLGALLDASVRAGGNRIEGIQFEVKDMSSVQARARTDAWNDALAKGQQLAQLAGAQLGQVLTIDETSQTPRPVFAAAPAAAGAAEVPVQPGTQTVTTDLQVTWAITGGSEFPAPSATPTPAALPTFGTTAPATSTPLSAGTATSMATSTPAAGTPLATSTVSGTSTPTASAFGGTSTPATGAAFGTSTPATGAALPQPTLSALATGAPTPVLTGPATSMPLGTSTPMAGAAATTSTAQPTARALAGAAATSPAGTPSAGGLTEQGDIVIGLVQSVDSSSRAITISGEQGPVILATSTDTQLLGPNGNTLAVTDFRPGVLVRADGQTDPAGRFIARRVQLADRSALFTVLGEITGKSPDGQVIDINSVTGGFNRLYLTSDASVTLPDGRDYPPAQLVPGTNVEATGMRGSPGTLITYHVAVVQR